MLTWMRSYGEVQRIGVESTGSYGAGLLRFLQLAGLTVLEVTTPDKCVFQDKAASDSDPFRPLIPTQSGHRFRRKSATDSDRSRPPC